MSSSAISTQMTDQGDNLLIGRITLLMTFADYLSDRWNREAAAPELKKIANIIAWNFWQMDGLTGTVPLGEPEEEIHQYSLFEMFGNEGDKKLPSAEYLIGGQTSQFYMNP